MTAAVLVLWFCHDLRAELFYIRTNAENYEQLEEQTALLNTAGFHVRHIFPPNELIVSGKVFDGKWKGKPSFVTEFVSESEAMLRTPGSGDDIIYQSFRSLATTPFQSDTLHLDKLPAQLKSDCFGKADTAANRALSPLTSEPDRFTANYMLGRTAVALMFIESNGGLENWTANSKQAMFNSAIQGFDWWCDQAEMRNANVSFVYETHLEIPTATEPIEQETMPQKHCIGCESFWTFSWVGEALDYLGYAGEWDEVFRHCNDLRRTYSCNWAFEMYLVNAENDADHFFKSSSTNGYAQGYDEVRYCHWSDIRNDQIAVVAYSSAWAYDMAATVSHEAGHIFGAADEYKESEGGCPADDCTRAYGYLRVDNGNCLTCNDRGVSCMMRNNYDRVCDYTMGHVGWRDSDGDGAADAIDPSNGGWQSIQNVNPGDLIRIYTLAYDFVNSIAVTSDNMFRASPTQSFVIWDGHNYDDQICVINQTFYVTINNGSPFTLRLNSGDPGNTPVFTGINYANGNLAWNLDKSFAYVRCFIYDASSNLIARPIWDKLYAAHYQQSLDMDFLPSGQTYTAKFFGWCPDGGKSQTVNYSFTHQCSHCGDADGSGTVDISDAVYLIAYIFSGGPAPGDCGYPQGLGDANGDGEIDISDAVYLISYIFSGGPPPHCA
jgi:hypothetical protein